MNLLPTLLRIKNLNKPLLKGFLKHRSSALREALKSVPEETLEGLSLKVANEPSKAAGYYSHGNLTINPKSYMIPSSRSKTDLDWLLSVPIHELGHHIGSIRGYDDKLFSLLVRENPEFFRHVYNKVREITNRSYVTEKELIAGRYTNLILNKLGITDSTRNKPLAELLKRYYPEIYKDIVPSIPLVGFLGKKED